MRQPTYEQVDEAEAWLDSQFPGTGFSIELGSRPWGTVAWFDGPTQQEVRARTRWALTFVRLATLPTITGAVVTRWLQGHDVAREVPRTQFFFDDPHPDVVEFSRLVAQYALGLEPSMVDPWRGSQATARYANHVAGTLGEAGQVLAAAAGFDLADLAAKAGPGCHTPR